MSPDANPEQNLAPEVKDTRSHPVWGVYDRLRTARLNVKYYGCRLQSLKRQNFWLESVLLATAPSSAIAALWFWQTTGGRAAWQALGLVAAIAAVLKPVLKLTPTITQHESLVTGYRLLEYDLLGLKTEIEQQRRYDEPLQAEFKKSITKERDLVSQAPLEPADRKLRSRCQREVLEELPLEGFFVPCDDEKE
jgi:hypothetical protein